MKHGIDFTTLLLSFPKNDGPKSKSLKSIPTPFIEHSDFIKNSSKMLRHFLQTKRAGGKSVHSQNTSYIYRLLSLEMVIKFRNFQENFESSKLR